MAARLLGMLPTVIFLLAGQSNMGGRGGATKGPWDGVVPPECAPSPRILRLSPDLHWEEAHEPLHAGIDVHNVLGVGPGMAFAHTLLSSSSTSGVIGLVPCAQGGTPIANWSRGTDLYDRMVTRARAATAATGASLGALLWYQGEADTIRREDAEVYAGRMEAMVRDVRRDLHMPDLLVIQVGIATGQGKFVDLVREAQRKVRLPRLRYVDAKGLPIANDYTHLTTPAQVRLGKMLAKAYLSTL
uniref:Sialate O-acetylesterase domain-containing protein n=1 Tax=Leersia perrieri TaxID=77586 RepID=A0A0D9W1L7_9ORYZ